jgi:Ca-activated chloride channel homolog
VVAVLAAPLLLPALVVAQDAPLGVWIDKPAMGEAIFGPQEIQIAVESQEPVVVEVRVDGELIAVVQRRPFHLVHDFGYENVPHVVEAWARTAKGQTASTRVKTGTIAIDEEIDLRLQQLYVTVTRADRRISGLTRDDFRVQDLGDRQEIVTFERGDVPLTAVLLLDSSLSMAGPRIEAALEGAQMFLDGMAPLDEAMVMLFSDRLLRSTPFASDGSALGPALQGVEAAGGTALNDYLFMALKELDRRQGRRVVVLFSDGSDVHSVLPMTEVLLKAQISPALIYWIHLQKEDEADGPPSHTSSWRNVQRNQEDYLLLREAIEASGGQVRAVHGLDELGKAFVEVLAELRGQYVLGYYPKQDLGDGSWHEVKVRVTEPGVDVRTRGGYFDY